MTAPSKQSNMEVEHVVNDREYQTDLALQAAHVGLINWDIAADKIDWDQRSCEIFGLGQQAVRLSYADWSRRIFEADRHQVDNRIRAALNDAEVSHFELNYRISNGSSRPRAVRMLGSFVRDQQGHAHSFNGLHLDVTREHELNSVRAKRAEAVFEQTHQAILITDAEGIVQDCNQAFTTLTGFPVSEVVNQPAELFSQRSQATQIIKQELAQHNHWDGNYVTKTKSGRVLVERVSVSAVRDDQQQIVTIVIVFLETTRSKQYQEQLHQLANYDPLTQLPNRHLFQVLLDKALTRVERYPHRLSVLFIDLDHFKPVNDSYGHCLGDQVLTQASERLQRQLRDNDILARVGGDEFVALTETEQEETAIAALAQRLIDAFKEPFSVNTQPVYLGLSVGISTFPSTGQSADMLVQHADAAMYEAKRNGGNTFRFYHHTITQAAQSRLRLEQQLRLAIKHQQLCIHYQPLHDLSSGSLVGCEALVRWQHPTRGLLLPKDFIPLAESSGLIQHLGEHVFKLVLKETYPWLAQGALQSVSVHVSSHQLMQPQLLERLDALMAPLKFKPEWLDLEITEGTLLEHLQLMNDRLLALKQRGIRLSIDNYGSGASSLGYISHLPLSRLKIDRNFTQGLPGDSHNQAISQAIIALGRSLKIEVVAEGLEQSEQAAYLQQQGASTGQGWLFSEPLTAQQMNAYIQTNMSLHSQSCD